MPLCAFSVKLTIIQCYFILWLGIRNLTNHDQLLGKMVNQFFRTECFILFIQLSLVYLLYCHTCSGMKGTPVYNFDDSFKSVQTFGNISCNKFNNYFFPYGNEKPLTRTKVIIIVIRSFYLSFCVFLLF